MRRTLAAAIALFVAALASPALADAPLRALAQYQAGDFLDAAKAGEAEGGAAGLVIAARSLLALVVGDLHEPACAMWLDRAERDAESALALAPDDIEPRLNLALTLGVKGRRASVGEALRHNYAKRGRALIEEALALSPDEPRAQALLGAWNLEVVRRGGALGARLMGASMRAGVRAFEQARALAPEDPAIALQYAVALLALDPDRYGERARDLLEAAATSRPADAFEGVLAEEAKRLGAVMATRGAQAAAESAEQRFM
jgi:hypothetical protein